MYFRYQLFELLSSDTRTMPGNWRAHTEDLTGMSQRQEIKRNRAVGTGSRFTSKKNQESCVVQTS